VSTSASSTRGSVVCMMCLGIEAYEAFTNVFFLDVIERVSGGDAAGEAFRTVQLRARDGELTEDDYAFMKQHMLLEGREAEFLGPQTYKLVTTQAARDARNNEEFEAAPLPHCLQPLARSRSPASSHESLHSSSGSVMRRCYVGMQSRRPNALACQPLLYPPKPAVCPQV